MLDLASAAPAAATLPLFLPQAPPDKVSGLIHAATLIAQLLGQGRAADSRALRAAMDAAFGGSDAEGAWVWKDAYVYRRAMMRGPTRNHRPFPTHII